MPRFLLTFFLCLASVSYADEDRPPSPAVAEEPPPLWQPDPTSPLVPWDAQEIVDFSLIDQTGTTITKRDLLGRPWVANFIFTRCRLECPLVCQKIYELEKELQAADVRFVTITVDPEVDNVATMKAYSENFNAVPERWLFLTGNSEDIGRLLRYGFKVSALRNTTPDVLPGEEWAHSLSLVLVDADGKVRGRFDSSRTDLNDLRRVLLGQASVPAKNQPLPVNATIDPPRNPDSVTKRAVPAWVLRLPTTNAALNGLSALLLLIGYFAVKARMLDLHRRTMLLAFGVSVLFLTTYLTYHFALHHYTGESSRRYTGTGLFRTVYFTVLISHVILAMIVPVLAIITIRRGLKRDWVAHKRIARITFPIWMYVSVTGVVIYVMLYGFPGVT